VVENLTQYPKAEALSLSPATGTRWKSGKKYEERLCEALHCHPLESFFVNGGKTITSCPHHPKMNGSSPAAATGSRRETISKCMKGCEVNQYTMLRQPFKSFWPVAVVEHSPHYPKVEGLSPSPATGIWRKNGKKYEERLCEALHCQTLEYFLVNGGKIITSCPHHPKVNSSSPAAATGSRREEITKCMKECDANHYTVLCQLFNSVWLATAAKW